MPAFHSAVERGSTRIGLLRQVAVGTCGRIEPDLRWIRSRRVWDLVGLDAPDSLRRLGTVRYGEAPPGFREGAPAEPLVAGCYGVLVSADSGHGSTSFWVDSAGAIRSWTDAEEDSARAVWQRHDRAYRAARPKLSELCREAYTAAQTRADSESVHRMVLWDTARFVPLTCRGMPQQELKRNR